MPLICPPSTTRARASRRGGTGTTLAFAPLGERFFQLPPRPGPAGPAWGGAGPLCARRPLPRGGGGRTGAVEASWVSQASFTPPGITVAVAKDRAVEALLHKGDRFALMVLAEGRESSPMKQFLRPFAPGDDRFAGLEVSCSPANQPLLPDALAWLEAEVKQRMECGDHWLIYAEVREGGVLDSDGQTAVHHRRSGAQLLSRGPAWTTLSPPASESQLILVMTSAKLLLLLPTQSWT
jgi:Conserved protein/domain typically associated with flavoprotein oxygenases, DIM6/NTAB family